MISVVALKTAGAQARDTAGRAPLTWSAPKFVEQPPFQHGIEIEAVSCAFDFFSQGPVPAVACGGTTLCVAGSNHGELIIGRRP